MACGGSLYILSQATLLISTRSEGERPCPGHPACNAHSMHCGRHKPFGGWTKYAKQQMSQNAL